MKKNIFTVEELIGMGRKIARLAGNRTLKVKSVNSKKKSMRENGMLVPAIFVEATVAREQNLDVVDWLTGEAVTEKNAQEYIVLIDGQHRYEAYRQLIEDGVDDGVDYVQPFYLMESLNPKASISHQLLEINTVSNPWDGIDYARTTLMMVDDPDEYPTLQEIAKLTAQGYSLPSASEWATFTNGITKTVLVNLINNRMVRNVELLKSDSGLDRCRVLLEAAGKSFGLTFRQKRLLIDWICARYRETKDADKGNFTKIMAGFLESIDRTEADKIEKTRGLRGGETRESLINKELDKLYKKYLQSLENK